jgi:hypothetical protein
VLNQRCLARALSFCTVPGRREIAQRTFFFARLDTCAWAPM